MKKIVVVLVVFVANIVSVDAMKLEVRKKDKVRLFNNNVEVDTSKGVFVLE